MKSKAPKKPAAAVAAKAKSPARHSPKATPKKGKAKRQPVRRSRPRRKLPKDVAPPAHQAVSPLSGVAPPAEFQFKPGQSGNPAGRPSAGATIREWLNVLAAQELTEQQVRAIARDAKAPWTRRAAAERILRTIEAGDLADMEPLLDGTTSVEGLRKKGVNTEIIKRIKVRRKTLYDDKEAIGEEVEREVELHDRAAGDFDRVCDRTEGRPTQIGKMEVSGPGGGPIPTAPQKGEPDFGPDQFSAAFEQFTQGGGLGVVARPPSPPVVMEKRSGDGAPCAGEEDAPDSVR